LAVPALDRRVALEGEVLRVVYGNGEVVFQEADYKQIREVDCNADDGPALGGISASAPILHRHHKRTAKRRRYRW
jgi:hypothetical protein